MNDSYTVGLASGIIKYFERLVTAHVASARPSTHDPHNSTHPLHSPPAGAEKAPMFPRTRREAPRPAHQVFSVQLDSGGLEQRPAGCSTGPRESWPRDDQRSTHKANATVRFAHGIASVNIINNEMAYKERITALTEPPGPHCQRIQPLPHTQPPTHSHKSLRPPTQVNSLRLLERVC